MFERASAVLRGPRKLLRQVGVLGMSSAVRRLPDVLNKSNDGVRSGRLMSSIRAGVSGNGGGDTVFNLSDAMVEVGTNVPYAAQRQYGGPIFPTGGHKALAIPVPIALKRSGESPRDLDPNRTILQFVPIYGHRNIVGKLVDGGVEGPLEKGKRKREAKTAYGPGTLFLLASYVEQEGTPFLYWSDEDKRVIDEELWPKFLGVR